MHKKDEGNIEDNGNFKLKQNKVRHLNNLNIMINGKNWEVVAWVVSTE